MNLTLRFQPNELDYIAQLLAKQPWGEVNALMVNIQNQVTAQQQPLTGNQEMQHARTSGNGADAPNGRGESAEFAGVGSGG
jgi:hypothetical protein